MKKYNLFILITLCSIILSSNTMAKGISKTSDKYECLDKNIVKKEEVSLIDLIKIGICNNPSLRVDYMITKESEANLGSAKSEYYPSINLNAIARKTSQTNQNYHTNENNPYNLNIGLSLLLYDFGGRSARIDSFKSYLASSGFNYNSALQNLILSVHTAYFKLLGAKEDLKSAKSTEAMYKKSFDEASRKYDVGLAALNDKLQTQTSYEQSKLRVIEMENAVRVIGPEVLKPIDIKTLPHPGFPTDVQAQFMAMLTVANGSGTVIETVFENRFLHVAEFNRMGADIKIEGRSAIVKGVKKLHGAKVNATDLRAGAALILCGLIAEGETQIGEIYHIQRGYVDIDKKITALGGNIEIIED